MYVDVYLSATILLLSVLNRHISYLSEPLLKWLNKATSQEQKLLDKKLNLQKEQSQINIVDCFAKHAKIQRKINAIDEELSELRNNRRTNNFITHLLFRYGMKLPIGILLLFMVVFYRSSPVFILNEQLDLFPFSLIISYPLKDINAVSVHAWMLCCNSAIRAIKF